MSFPFRSSHIPVNVTNVGWKTILLPNRAGTYFLREDNYVDNYITSFIDYTITSTDEFMPAGLSFKVYGTREYWWFICWFNGIVFPTEQFQAGRTIKLPDQAQIESYLKRTETIFGFGVSKSSNANPKDRIVRI